MEGLGVGGPPTSFGTSLQRVRESRGIHSSHYSYVALQ